MLITRWVVCVIYIDFPDLELARNTQKMTAMEKYKILTPSYTEKSYWTCTALWNEEFVINELIKRKYGKRETRRYRHIAKGRGLKSLSK